MVFFLHWILYCLSQRRQELGSKKEEDYLPPDFIKKKVKKEIKEPKPTKLQPKVSRAKFDQISFFFFLFFFSFFCEVIDMHV